VGGGEWSIAACSHVVTQALSLCREEVLCRKPKDYQGMVQKVIVGASVLTRYNNRIYRVDDIDWSKSPSSTFATHTGELVSIMIEMLEQLNILIMAFQDVTPCSLVDEALLRGRWRQYFFSDHRLNCVGFEVSYGSGYEESGSDSLMFLQTSTRLHGITSQEIVLLNYKKTLCHIPEY
jgi:hypothetical protein